MRTNDKWTWWRTAEKIEGRCIRKVSITVRGNYFLVIITKTIIIIVVVVIVIVIMPASSILIKVIYLFIFQMDIYRIVVDDKKRGRGKERKTKWVQLTRLDTG